MFTKTLALMQRGLRRDARTLTQHMLRIGMLGIVALAVFGAHVGSLSVGAPGLAFFIWIIWTTLVFSTVAGATFFATAITEEKEEQTLGLLTLANIRPAALIAGKFLPRLLNALLILTLVLPFTLLAITLGGVSWNQVWAAYWTLLAHIVFMGSIGLFFSVICRRSGTAITWSILAMLAYFGGLPLLWSVAAQLLQYAGGGTILAHIMHGLETLAEASAFWRVVEILQTGFDEGAFGVQVVGNLAISLLLLAASWALYGVFNQGAEGSAQALPVLDRALRFRRGSRRPWSHALVWKDFHYLAGGWEWLLLRTVIYPVVVGAITLLGSGYQSPDKLRVDFGEGLVACMLHLALPIEATILAARLFRAEIKDQTWATLAVLPQPIQRLALGKLGGGLLGLVPALGWTIIGAALIPEVTAASLIGPGGAGQALFFVSSTLYFLVFLHLTTLFSIMFNAWAGVLLALVTMWAGWCLSIPLFLLPLLFTSTLGGTASEWVGMLAGMGVLGAAFIGICFGLEVLIVQQLRSAAGR